MTEAKLMSTEEVSSTRRETLNSLNLPDDIIRWTWELTTGWQGDPLVHVLFVVRGEFAESSRFRPFLRERHQADYSTQINFTRGESYFSSIKSKKPSTLTIA